MPNEIQNVSVQMPEKEKTVFKRQPFAQRKSNSEQTIASIVL